MSEQSSPESGPVVDQTTGPAGSEPPGRWAPLPSSGVDEPPGSRPHAHATPALVLGLIATVGGLIVVPLAIGPLAWFLGLSARRHVAATPERWTGHGRATTGMVLGMIATGILLVLLFAAAVVAALLTVTNLLDSPYAD